MDKESKIFVFYVAVGNMDSKDVEEYMHRVHKKFFNDDFVKNHEGSQLILLPIRGTDSRIECINPKYITDEALVREHRLKMDELHEYAHKITAESKNKEEA
jgi:hypothetical protein